MKGLILSLCDHSGNWPKFYGEAGYDVRSIDLQRDYWADMTLQEFFRGLQ